MTTGTEWNLEFDILYNNISSNKAPGISAYEKSVFLTQAQEQILKGYFTPKGNKFQEGFDNSTERHIDFANITVVKDCISATNVFLSQDGTKYYYGAYEMPDDMLAIVNEIVTVKRGGENGPELNLQVIPLPYDDYVLTQSKPYKFPLRYQAWRVINLNKGQSKPIFEIIANFGDIIKSYKIKYIRKAKPIIIGDIGDLTIDGYTSGDTGNNTVNPSNPCELDPILHREILQRAVELAKAAYTGNLGDQITLGHTSITNLGGYPPSKEG